LPGLVLATLGYNPKLGITLTPKNSVQKSVGSAKLFPSLRFAVNFFPLIAELSERRIKLFICQTHFLSDRTAGRPDELVKKSAQSVAQYISVKIDAQP
jgi:hypothetical protein